MYQIACTIILCMRHTIHGSNMSQWLVDICRQYHSLFTLFLFKCLSNHGIWHPLRARFLTGSMVCTVFTVHSNFVFRFMFQLHEQLVNSFTTFLVEMIPFALCRTTKHNPAQRSTSGNVSVSDTKCSFWSHFVSFEMQTNASHSHATTHLQRREFPE